MPDLWMDVDTALSEVPVNILPLLDDTDFKTRETAVAFNAAGMDLVWNFVTAAGAFTQTAVTPTSAGTYDWTHQGDGMYTIEIPASAGASINNDTEGFGWFIGLVTGVLPWRGPVIGLRAAGLNDKLIESAYDTTRGLAGTALPAATAEAAGGLYTRGTGAGQINQAADGMSDANVVRLANVAQSLTDLKDFADDGYDPSTNKVQGVVLVDTLTTYTGNTPQTGDSFARLGAPAGASVSADIAAIEAQTDDIGVAGAGLTAIPWNASWDAEVQSEVDDALVARFLDKLVTINGTADSGTTTTMVDAARTEGDADYWKGSIILFTSGSISGQARMITDFDIATDTFTFTPALTQAVATQTYVILPAISVWDDILAEHLISGSTGAALNAAGAAGDPWSTALPGAYGAGTAGKIVGDNVNATISSRATQTSVDTLDDFVDTEVAAIKAKTDQLIFSTVNRVDAQVFGIENNVITAASINADAVTEIQSGLATAAALTTVQADTDDIQTRLPVALTADGNMKADTLRVGGTLQTAGDIIGDTNDIQTRLPAALVSGRMDSSVGAMAANTLTAAATAADYVTEVQSGLASQTSVDDLPTNAELATALTNLDAAVTTRAPAATALSTAQWTNTRAGYLDILNTLKLKKNTAYNNFTFLLVDDADHVTPATGITVTAERSIDGAAFAACANAVAEISAGCYKINLATTDLNGDNIILKFTGTGADQRTIFIAPQP